MTPDADRLYWQSFGQRIAILGAAGKPRAAIEAEVSRTMRRVNSEWKQRNDFAGVGVGGHAPADETEMRGSRAVAEMVPRRAGNPEVAGSSPACSGGRRSGTPASVIPFDVSSKGGPYETLPQIGGSSVAVRWASRDGGMRLHSLPAAELGVQRWRRRLDRPHAATVVLTLATFGLAITAAAMIPHATPQQAGIVAAVLPFVVGCASRWRRAKARVIEMPRRAAERGKAA